MKTIISLLNREIAKAKEDVKVAKRSKSNCYDFFEGRYCGLVYAKRLLLDQWEFTSQKQPNAQKKHKDNDCHIDPDLQRIIDGEGLPPLIDVDPDNLPSGICISP